jgi:ammonium transporter Rh
MIFVGFGFLMTFLKRYCWSAVGMNFIIAAFVIQVSMITNGFWKNIVKTQWSIIEISMDTIIDADFAAGSVLIAVGAVLGKLNFIQYIFMAIFQTFFYSLSYNLGQFQLKAFDIGGSIFIHTFGAYFGLAVSYAYNGKIKDFKICSGNYNSNTFAYIGTIFLWIFWPSFNGALSSGDAQQRAIINTLLALTGSCISVFLISPFFKNGKFHAEYILNATLAGGVTIGNTADLISQPWISITIGFFAGFASLLGYVGVNEFLFKNISLHDTCGVHYLHGITGVSGGIVGIFIAFMSDSKEMNWENRTSTTQALYQVIALGMVLGIAIFSGLICGLFLRLFEAVEAPFDDEELWETEEDELEIANWMKIEETVKNLRNRNANKTNENNRYDGNRNSKVKVNNIEKGGIVELGKNINYEETPGSKDY